MSMFFWFWFYLIKNLTEILNFSVNIDSTKKTEHILEMPGLGEYDYMSQINS